MEGTPSAADKVVFPYSSMKEATKDRFAKIGGVEQAFRFLKQGYKFIAWSRRTRKRNRDRERAADVPLDKRP